MPGVHAHGTDGIWKFTYNQTSPCTKSFMQKFVARYSHTSRIWARWSSTRELVNQAWTPNWASSCSLTQMLMAKWEVSLKKFHRPERLWLYGNLEGSKPQKWSNPSVVGTVWGRGGEGPRRLPHYYERVTSDHISQKPVGLCGTAAILTEHSSQLYLQGWHHLTAREGRGSSWRRWLWSWGSWRQKTEVV